MDEDLLDKPSNTDTHKIVNRKKCKKNNTKTYTITKKQQSLMLLPQVEHIAMY